MSYKDPTKGMPKADLDYFRKHPDQLLELFYKLNKLPMPKAKQKLKTTLADNRKKAKPISNKKSNNKTSYT